MSDYGAGILLNIVMCLPRRALDSDPRVPELKKKVEDFAGSFEMPGFDVKSIDHKAVKQNQTNGFSNGHLESNGTSQDHAIPALNPVPC